MRERQDPLAKLWQSVHAPEADELRRHAQLAAVESQRIGLVPARRRIRARWAVAAAVVLLLIGSGLGFSLASSLTPSGTAGRNVVGLGFLPGSGWAVVQTAGPAPGTTRAVATKGGIRLSVTSTPRGDPAQDVDYPVRQLPLRIADAYPVASSSDLELRAGVGGYNIHAHIRGASAAATVAAAQLQLERLVVAAQRVTIAVRPTIATVGVFVTAFGTVDSGKAGESVTVQAKDCGSTFFRVFAGASTEQGGGWSTFVNSQVNTVLRAVWNGETSTEVKLSVRVFLQLRQISASRFRVGPTGYGTRFVGKLVTIQRFDQRLGRWEKVMVVKAGETPFGTKFTLRVPRGTRIRAVFPNAQAGPCFVGGTSPVIRT